jgi:diacylglycerol kinase (ATP)
MPSSLEIRIRTPSFVAMGLPHEPLANPLHRPGSMRITVVHNPLAGYEGDSAEELLEELHRAGYEPTCVSIKSKRWRPALEDPGDLVVAAGGDGTVRAVALELAGREVPIAVVPLGTANNLARALGVSGPLRSQVAAWRRREVRRFDVCVARGPRRERRFLESLGVGAVARLIQRLKSHEGEAGQRFDHAAEQLQRDLTVLEKIVERQAPRRWRIEADGRDLSGNYLLVELMNVRRIGPGLPLAPRANPGDGRLDVVRIGEEERKPLLRCVGDMRRNLECRLRLRTVRASAVRIEGESSEIHVDDALWRKKASRGSPLRVDVTVERGAVRFL